MDPLVDGRGRGYIHDVVYMKFMPTVDKSYTFFIQSLLFPHRQMYHPVNSSSCIRCRPSWALLLSKKYLVTLTGPLFFTCVIFGAPTDPHIRCGGFIIFLGLWHFRNPPWASIEWPPYCISVLSRFFESCTDFMLNCIRCRPLWTLLLSKNIWSHWQIKWRGAGPLSFTCVLFEAPWPLLTLIWGVGVS